MPRPTSVITGKTRPLPAMCTFLLQRNRSLLTHNRRIVGSRHPTPHHTTLPSDDNVHAFGRAHRSLPSPAQHSLQQTGDTSLYSRKLLPSGNPLREPLHTRRRQANIGRERHSLLTPHSGKPLKRRRLSPSWRTSRSRYKLRFLRNQNRKERRNVRLQIRIPRGPRKNGTAGRYQLTLSRTPLQLTRTRG